MASWCQLRRNLFRIYFNVNKQIKHVKAVGGMSFQSTSTSQSPDFESSCDTDISVTRKSNITLCLHNVKDISYELTKPISRTDCITDSAETYDLVLKSWLSKTVFKNKKNPAIEELSKMFYTTKHRWYPVGQYHTRRRKQNPPKDR